MKIFFHDGSLLLFVNVVYISSFAPLFDKKLLSIQGVSPHAYKSRSYDKAGSCFLKGKILPELVLKLKYYNVYEPGAVVSLVGGRSLIH
jgi:hypothetical protein